MFDFPDQSLLLDVLERGGGAGLPDELAAREGGFRIPHQGEGEPRFAGPGRRGLQRRYRRRQRHEQRGHQKGWRIFAVVS